MQRNYGNLDATGTVYYADLELGARRARLLVLLVPPPSVLGTRGTRTIVPFPER